MYLFKLRVEESDRLLRQKLLETKASNSLSEQSVGVDFKCENTENQDNEEADEQNINAKTKKCFCNKKFAKEDSLLKHKISHLVKMRDVGISITKDNIEVKEQTLGQGPVVFFETVALESDNANSKSKVPCFSCLLCNCIFLNEELLEKHLDDHAVKIKLNTIQDNDIQELKVHIRKKHSEKKRYL